jgi:hypothetical protein
LKAVRYWLLSAAWCAVAFAAPPPAAPPDQQRASSPDAADATPGVDTPGVDTPGVDTPGVATPTAPNEDFIEFLGADDVEDAAWWEFLRKSAPRRAQPPVPPQDAKQ